jgi:hypothetical protein
MFLRKRRWLATAGLLAAILAVPAPSLAAGRKGPAADVSGLMERAWAMLERLARVPVAVWEKQGMLIDPNGVTYTVESDESKLAAAPREPAGGSQ